MGSAFDVFAGNKCVENCKGDDYICAKESNSRYFWYPRSYYLNENTKIIEIYRYSQNCSTGIDTGNGEKCHVLFYKLDNEWIPVSISCVPRNDFIFRGYIEEIQKVKVKDKNGNIRIVEVIKGQKRIRMEAEQKYWYDVDNYKDIVPNGYDIYYSLDELKKKGYTILEIIDEKKKQKKAKEKTQENK